VVEVVRTGRSLWAVRYDTDPGGSGEVGGFASAASARAAAQQLTAWRGVAGVVDGRWAPEAAGGDPSAGLTMRRWASLWLDSLDVAPTTMAQYRSLVRNHIEPRFGELALGEISGLDARMWALSLRRR
jgi:hypothetical protein